MREFKLSGSLNEYGLAVIDEIILFNADTRELIKAKGCVDTGAAYIYVRQEIIDKLNLKITRTGYQISPTKGKVSCPFYSANVVIENINFGPFDIQPMLSDYPLDVIVGCEFLGPSVFHYDGPLRRWSLQITAE